MPQALPDLAAALADPHARRVGALIRDAFIDVLGDRLDALLVHGSALTGGYIEGFSDFDFLVFMRGPLSLDDAIALQRALGDVDHAPFAYLQVSRLIDLDVPPPETDRALLIEGGYARLLGDYPEGWPLLDAAALDRASRDVLADLRGLHDRQRHRWTVATGDRRRLELRYQLTVLKPAVRAHLVRLGGPPLEVWTSSYPELTRRWLRLEPALGARFRDLIARLPPPEGGEAAAGEAMLALIDEIAHHPATAAAEERRAE
jgi:predicted nucleotidyltransferase